MPFDGMSVTQDTKHENHDHPRVVALRAAVDLFRNPGDVWLHPSTYLSESGAAACAIGLVLFEIEGRDMQMARRAIAAWLLGSSRRVPEAEVPTGEREEKWTRGFFGLFRSLIQEARGPHPLSKLHPTDLRIMEVAVMSRNCGSWGALADWLESKYIPLIMDDPGKRIDDDLKRVARGWPTYVPGMRVRDMMEADPFARERERERRRERERSAALSQYLHYSQAMSVTSTGGSGWGGPSNSPFPPPSPMDVSRIRSTFEDA